MTSGEAMVASDTAQEPANAKILVVVEDDPDVQFLVEAIFAMDPRFTITAVAASAEEALECPPTSEPGIIVLDHGLAGPLPALTASPPSTRSCSRRSPRSSCRWPRTWPAWASPADPAGQVSR